MSSKLYVSETRISPMSNYGSMDIHGPYGSEEEAAAALERLVKKGEKNIEFLGDVEETTVTSHKGRDGISTTIVAGFHDEGGYAALSTVTSYHFQLVWIGSDYSLREKVDDIVGKSTKTAAELRERSEWKSCPPEKSAKLNELADALAESADKIASMLPDNPDGLVKA